MVNMGELFAHPRIHRIKMDLVPVDQKDHHYLLAEGDLLFARQSLVLSGAGQCSIFMGNAMPTVFESHLIRCRLDTKRSNPLFYFYFFRSPEGRRAIEAIVEQGAGASGIRGSDLINLQVPSPTKELQDHIAMTLGALDDRISLLRETNATLEAIAQALFKSWFVDFDPVRAKMAGRAPEGMDETTAALFPDALEETALGLVPAGWKVGSILDIATLLSGGTPKTDRPEYWGGNISWASAKDVSQASDPVLLTTERTITELGLNGSSTKLIPAYATAVVARGATTGRLVMFGKEMAMNQTCYAVVSRQNTPTVLSLQLRREIGRLVSAAHGSVFDTITTTTFEKSVCLLPPEALCTQLERITRPIFDKIIANVAKAQLLSQLRDALLPRLISGHLRLPEAQAQLEDALA